MNLLHLSGLTGQSFKYAKRALPRRACFACAFFLGIFLVVAKTQPATAQNSCQINVIKGDAEAKATAMKKQCRKDYDRVQTYCTEKGLQTIQIASVGGQAAVGAISVLKSDEKTNSAKKTAGLSKKLSYGMAALNTGIGAKCLMNIKSCVKSCGAAEQTIECLQTKKEAAASNGAAAEYQLLIETLGEAKPGERKSACKHLKSNAVAAIAQGAIHGAMGMIQAKVERQLGSAADKENEEAEEESVPYDPDALPSAPTFPPIVEDPGITSANSAIHSGAGEYAGNKTGHADQATDDNEDFSDFSNEDETEGEAPFPSDGNGGLSAPSSGGGPGRDGALSSSADGAGGNKDKEASDFNKGGSGSLAGASPLYGGGGDHDDGYDGEDEEGYYEPLDLNDEAEEEDGEDMAEEERAMEEDGGEEERIGGKQENIFEMAAKILSEYCLSGPLRCE